MAAPISRVRASSAAEAAFFAGMECAAELADVGSALKIKAAIAEMQKGPE